MILLDIEGTTSSISFVYDVMFPYVREHLASFLSDRWAHPAVQDCLPLLATDVEQASVDVWLGLLETDQKQKTVAEAVLSLMDRDIKSTGLKKLQGQIWEAGFKNGDLVAHLYDDVPPALERWSDLGLELRVYSSGSVQAQQLFFGHTVAGNLLPWFQRHYDTTLGPKTDEISYDTIASDFGRPTNRVLFISDVAAELDAANQAGMQTALSIRPGNKPVENADRYQAITSFDQIDELFGLS